MLLAIIFFIKMYCLDKIKVIYPVIKIIRAIERSIIIFVFLSFWNLCVLSWQNVNFLRNEKKKGIRPIIECSAHPCDDQGKFAKNTSSQNKSLYNVKLLRYDGFVYHFE